MSKVAATYDDWVAARRAFLAKEKAHMQERDALAAERRALPRLLIEKHYDFDGPSGRETLLDLFCTRSQLLVYHFMYGADWGVGCTSCSFWADNLSGVEDHLAHPDVSLVFVSTAPFATVDAYRRKMGWTFKWVGDAGDFNRDLKVKFTEDEVQSKTGGYNYGAGGFPSTEAPGLTCFEREGDAIYMTYGSYARGVEHFNGAYQLLDLAPKGRDEDALSYPMAWLRRRGEYE